MFLLPPSLNLGDSVHTFSGKSVTSDPYLAWSLVGFNSSSEVVPRVPGHLHGDYSESLFGTGDLLASESLQTGPGVALILSSDFQTLRSPV